jgi:hypothetical protein
MCGIHFCLALGMTFNSWNNLQNITTLPTLLPLILFCTSIETEWFHVFLLVGYILFLKISLSYLGLNYFTKVNKLIKLIAFASIQKRVY